MSDNTIHDRFKPGVTLTPTVAILCMIGSAAAWGGGMVMSKVSLGTIPPFTLLAVQLGASVAALWVLTLLLGQRPALTGQTLRIGWTGVLEPGLAYILGLIGMTMTTASSASFIAATEPFGVMVLAFLLWRERITRHRLILMTISVIGVILISTADPGGSAAHSLLGDALVLLGTMSAALYVVFSSRSVEQMRPFPLAALQQSYGLLFALLVLPIGLLQGEAVLLASVSVGAWLWAMLSGLVQYMLAFSLYLTALQRIPVTKAALYLTLIPVFGAAGSILFLGEQMTLLQGVGGAMVLLALLWLRGPGGST
jgi:drug/metabolite transporter (DMT)-like permease